MNWHTLSDISLLNSLHQKSSTSSDSTFVIFKHSTRCNTSTLAKKLFEQFWEGAVPVYLLLVVEHRLVSNAVSNLFKVDHESPQVLLIKNGLCVHHSSHSMIDASELTTLASSEKSR